MRIFLLGFLAVFLGIFIFLYPQKRMKDDVIVAQESCYFVAVDSLNLRESASVDSKILGKLKRNAKICANTIKNGFLQTDLGFLSMQYVSKNPIVFKKASQRVAKIPLPKEEKIALRDSKIKLISHKNEEDFLQKAEQLLAQKEYKKAKNLALLLNKENPQDLRSWEIFAKSVYLEGNKKEAINILQTILTKMPNDSLFLVLKAMQKGEKI